jgi:hypothetical protein
MRGSYRSPGLGKRQKEIRRAERQDAKAERKAQRRDEKRSAGDGNKADGPAAAVKFDRE